MMVMLDLMNWCSSMIDNEPTGVSPTLVHDFVYPRKLLYCRNRGHIYKNILPVPR